MTDEAIVLEKARAVIEMGKLPNRHPDRMWGGRGEGARCTICDTPVTQEEIEFEIEFATDGADGLVDRHRVHGPCLIAWEAERRHQAAGESGPQRDPT
jgi:hypothetical protein